MRLVCLSLVFALGPLGCPQREPQTQTEAELPAQPAQREATDTGENTPPEAGDESDSGPSATGAPSSADATRLEADPKQSQIGFAVARAMVGHIGHFEQFSASLELVGDTPSKLDIAVKTASVVADRRGLTSHLKSADFFDVGQFPTATFTAETVTPAPDAEPGEFSIVGTMRLHGVERKLEFPASIEIESDRVVGRATLDISAKSFGIAYEGMEAELADDDVSLEIELVFPRVADP